MEKRIVLAARPKGLPGKDSFRTEEFNPSELQEGEVLVKGVYYSVDPYMRGRMNDAKSYVPPFKIDQPIEGAVVAKVEESKSDKLKSGDWVLGSLPWATQTVASADDLRKLDVSDKVPAPYYLGILGMPGLTAYFGLLDIGKPQKGETVVVSGAAGAVGTVVGQIAKIRGCRVVGIAGTDEKINMLKDKFGYDAGINYKKDNVQEAIKKACPDGVDVYYDNVGGEISDAVISQINTFARIILCGQIALYNATEVPMGPRIQPLILTRSALMQGFIVRNYNNRFGEGMRQLIEWVKEGKLHYEETFVDGFDKLPEAFLGLFSGINKGKLIVDASK